MATFDELDATTRTELEAAAFRRLLKHLDDNKDVQNIDLMILADFCRNCLSKWYFAGARALSAPLSYDDACEAVYGMPYPAWKKVHQAKATAWPRTSATNPSPINGWSLKKKVMRAATSPARLQLGNWC